MLGCLLFALAGGFAARQISLTRVEELAILEVQALSPAPTSTRVLSAEERVPTWTPTPAATPTATATYTATATPTATATYTPTATPTKWRIRGNLSYTGNYIETEKCGRDMYEAAINHLVRKARAVGEPVPDYVPFNCLRYVQAFIGCLHRKDGDGSLLGINTHGTLQWSDWTHADGTPITWQYLQGLTKTTQASTDCVMPLMEQ